MADLNNYKIYSNERYQILGPNGYQDFKGLIVGENIRKIKLRFNNDNSIICTPKHKIKTKKGHLKYAKNFKQGDTLWCGSIVVDIEYFECDDKVYEFLHVDNHEYLVNDIISSQCLIIDEAGFIEPASMLEAFWRSVFPVVSSSKKAKIFMVSTPNGTGNLFHKTFSEAEAGINGWDYDRVDWKEVPGRDERWKRDQILAMGDYNSYLQEFEAIFLDSGDSTINEELYDRLKSFVRDPIYVMDEGCYKIFDEPKDGRIYVAGVDVSEGVGGDYSVINIFDITNLLEIKQVAYYANNTITPHIFTKKLDEVLAQWGKPLVCIERNNQGAQVVDNLRNIYMYENIVSWGASEAGRSKSQLGIISHTNTKQKGVGNMRYWVNTLRCVEFRDINIIKELKDFIRYPNGTWAAKKGANYHDDLVMSMVWALVILEDTLVQKYFEVTRVDDNRRPLEIRAIDYGMKYNVIPNGMYNETDNINSGMPTILDGTVSDTSDDLKWLQTQGWKNL